MSKDNSRTFEEVFNEERVNIIVEAIRTAVENACDKYDPVVGCNTTTFGTDVYNFGKHELKKLKTMQPKVFNYITSGNLFRLFVEDFELAYHRVGYDVSEGIENSFPNNEGVISRLLVQQLHEQMAFMGEGFDIKPSRKYVLGHFADPDSGLSGVYLCKPNKNANAVSWEVTHELWKADVENKEIKPTAKPRAAPVEKVGDIKLQPKEKLAEILLFPREEKGTMIDHE